MVNKIDVKHARSLSAQINEATDLTYEPDSAADEERPPHVRAASGMAPFYENHYAIIQDDANFLAMVDRDSHRVWSCPLPKGPEGKRTYGEGEAQFKLDLEACLTVPESGNRSLFAVGSGARGASREWIVTVDWPKGVDEPETQLIDPHRFYTSLRNNEDFSGAGLNIEGAIFADDDTVRLFQRGNAEPHDGLLPTDATGDVSWHELETYLNDPDNAPVPGLSNIVQYDIGNLDGVRLTFSDAEMTDNGVLFSASAEAPGDSDFIAGSVLGIIDDDGAKWSTIVDQDGNSFKGKMEGLSVHPDDPKHIYFVVDSDDGQAPSKVFEATLKGPWYEN